VATGDGNARALADRFAALKNPPDRLERHLVDRHRDERQCEQRASAHRVHVGDRIRRGDGAEVERVVDDRHEEIGRRNNRLRVIDLVHGGVVARLDADEQLRRDEARRAARTLRDDLLEHRRRELAAAAAAV